MSDFHMVLPFILGLIEDEEGNVLMGQHPDNGKKPFPKFWDLPGGKTEPNESIDDSLIREISEETGFTIDEIKLITTFHHHKDIFHPKYKSEIPSLAICYKITVSGEFKPTEMDDMQFIPKKELSKLQLTPWTKHFLEVVGYL